MIRKHNKKYQVVSKEGKVLGTYDTREEALKRLRQIEYFKHQEKK
jgi:hypothetical protein